MGCPPDTNSTKRNMTRDYGAAARFAEIDSGRGRLDTKSGGRWAPGMQGQPSTVMRMDITV